MMKELEKLILKNSYDLVLVYGDTNSTLAGALAAAKLHIPVAHVEAGLRSFNRRMPEEINRILTDQISDILFAPTPAAVRHLEDENFRADSIHLVGDVMYDAVLHFRQCAARQSRILDTLNLAGHAYVLCTIHRAENTNDLIRLRNIFSALLQLAQDIPVVLPLHPRTLSVLNAENIDLHEHRNLRLIEPVGYFDMMQLEAASSVIVTDSGGVQKEAFFHRVPCVTLREETEWVELIESGWNQLAPPTGSQSVLAAIKRAIGSVGKESDVYGEGSASRRIVQTIKKFG
jgi:UDP-GlcNAc3NAcA epimerase